MKSWRVRLGMAGGTLILGLLAIAQAQRDRSIQSIDDLSSTMVESGPPRPIPAGEFPSADLWKSPPPPALSVVRANNGDQGKQVGRIHPAGHAEPSGGTSAYQFAMPRIDQNPSLTTPAMQPPAMMLAQPASVAQPAPDAAFNGPSIGNPLSMPSVAPSLSMPSMPLPSLSMPQTNFNPPAAEAHSQASGQQAVGTGIDPTTDIRPSPSFNATPINGLRSADSSQLPEHNSPPPTNYPSLNLATSPPLSLISPAAVPASSRPMPPPEQNSAPHSRNIDVLPSPDLTTASSPLSKITSNNIEPSRSLTNAYAEPMRGATIASAAEAQPGDRQLDGAQSPSVLIQKKAPSEVKVGQAAVFVIQVRNTGTVTAYGVRVSDRVPQGMRMIDATPQPNSAKDALVWELGDLEPGGERAINLRLLPEIEGELGSVARVSFEAAASVRTMATRPELKVKQLAPAEVLIGQQVEIEIEISNPGSGSATGVVLQEDVPSRLEHPKGRQLDNHLGDLQPGESRRLTLRMMATEPGPVKNIVRLTSQEGLAVENTAEFEVIAPNLIVDLQGPSRRFLERQANFEVSIANTGTATASNIDLVVYLDRGLSFVSTEFKGQYDAGRHAVLWSLAELPAGQSGTVPLRLLPIETGTRVVRLETRGDLGLSAESEKTINVEALAELTFSVADVNDPIEVGSETSYEIRVTNNGSRDDANVKLQVELPPGLQLISTDPTAQAASGRIVSFAPLARLDAKGEYSFRVSVRGATEGAHVIRAMLTSDSSRVPVTKEESTLVYADQ